jgi:hypothetical protein
MIALPAAMTQNWAILGSRVSVIGDAGMTIGSRQVSMIEGE